jgi:hypothetical protein
MEEEEGDGRGVGELGSSEKEEEGDFPRCVEKVILEPPKATTAHTHTHTQPTEQPTTTRKGGAREKRHEEKE